MSARFLKALSISLALSATSHAMNETAYDLLSRDLAPSIKTLKSDTRLYHWYWASYNQDITKTTLNTADGRKASLDHRMKQVGSQFFTSQSTAYANAGNGLYLAIDPHSSSPEAAIYYSPGGTFSKGFGDSLMEVTLASGTTMINLENNNKILLQADTLAALESEGISIKTPAPGLNDHPETKEPTTLLDGGRFSRDTVRYMARPGAEAFRQLVNRIFTDQKISLIQYSWQSSVSAFCGRTSKLTALVWIGDYGVNRVVSNTLVYFPNPRFSALTSQEEESFVRTQKMRETFKLTRPEEALYKDAEGIHYTAYLKYKEARNKKKEIEKQKVEKQNEEAKKAEIEKLQAIMTEQQSIMDMQKPIMEQAKTNLSSIITTSYPDQVEIDELRSKTFECVK